MATTQKLHLTDTAIRNLIASDKRGTYQDTELQALRIRIEETNATWCYYRRIRYRLHNYTLGTYPEISPAKAREAAMAMSARILTRQGTGLSVLPTLGEAVTEYLESITDNDVYRRDAEYSARHYSHLFRRKINAITPADIRDVHEAMKDTPVAANHAVRRIRTAIKMAIAARGLSMDNPAEQVRLYRERPRTRILNAEEGTRLVKVLTDLSQDDDFRRSTSADALLMMLYTGQRKSNVLAMHLSEINSLNIWVIPGEKAKAGREIIVPLNSHALDILHRRQEKGMCMEGWVFPAVNRAGDIVHRLTCEDTWDKALAKAHLKGVHIHDLRRTLGSWMLMSGASIAEVSRTLGHTSIHVTEQVYAHILPDKIADRTESALGTFLGTGD